MTTIDPSSMEFEYFKTYIASTMKIFQETIKREVDELLQLLLLPLLDSIDRESGRTLPPELQTTLSECC